MKQKSNTGYQPNLLNTIPEKSLPHSPITGGSGQSNFDKHAKETSQPHITWIKPNGIQFEWNIGNKHLEIEFGENSILYLTEENKEILESEELFLTNEESTLKTINELNYIFDWLLA